jgi:hypothetical protein
MDLADFVRTTLQEILKGVREAQQTPDGKPPNAKLGIISPWIGGAGAKGKYFMSNGGYLVHMVEFDVAVTTESGDNVSGGGKISVLGFGVGSEGSVSSRDTTASRIKFEVPISLPPGDQ